MAQYMGYGDCVKNLIGYADESVAIRGGTEATFKNKKHVFFKPCSNHGSF